MKPILRKYYVAEISFHEGRTASNYIVQINQVRVDGVYFTMLTGVNEFMRVLHSNEVNSFKLISQIEGV